MRHALLPAVLLLTLAGCGGDAGGPAAPAPGPAATGASPAAADPLSTPQRAGEAGRARPSTDDAVAADEPQLVARATRSRAPLAQRPSQRPRQHDRPWAAGAVGHRVPARRAGARRLYVTTGDAGSGGLSQQDGLNGKVLRLTRSQYRGSTQRPERYATGLRNPQGLDWQPGSGRLWVTDHGPSGFDGPSGNDELNQVRRGANHGWPRVRGVRHGGFAAPAKVWSRTIAPSGLTFVSRGRSRWTGDLLVAALKGRSLRRVSVSGRTVTGEQVLYAGRYGRLRAVVEAPDATIWVTTSNNGDQYGSPVSADDDRILQIVPPRR